MKKTIVITLVVLAALAIGATAAYAQDAVTGAPYGAGHMRGWMGGEMQAYVQQALAEKLNVDESEIAALIDEGKSLPQIALDNGVAADDLAAFLTDVHTRAVELAVADGVITQDEADEFVNGMAARGAQGLLQDYMEKALAKKLGMTEAEVEALKAAGNSAMQIALDNGIASADLQTFLTDVRAEAIAAAVADGVITQEQADWMLTNQKGMHGFGGGMMGGRGGHGGGRGGRGGGHGMGGGWFGDQTTNP